MSITTKTGDDGKTSIRSKRVFKDNALVEAVGSLDELQASIQLINYELRITNLENITEDLYEIMGELAYGKKISNYELQITNLEKEIEKLERELGPIKNFITFKSIESNRLNWVRTVARRAERRVVSLSKHVEVDQNILIYLNRLSDYIFLLSRSKEK